MKHLVLFSSDIRFTIILQLLWLPFAVAAAETISEPTGTSKTDSQLANITLLLYTGQTIDEYTSVLLSDASNLLSKMDSKKPTVFYIFGWSESPSSESVATVVGAYLKRQDHNVILINWEEIAAEFYFTAASSASSVGSAVAWGLEKLVAAGLDPSTLHIVSHSLGSQVAGFVGRSANFTVQRITGLDPAGPGFYDIFADLTSSDAAFVDVIHTDAGVYGINSTNATVDFFPNGGSRFQPGCPLIRIPFDNTDFCSHHRSYYYYAESLLTEDAFIGVECSTYTDFQQHLCRSNAQVVMGYATPTTARGKIYLQTNSESPYGKGVDGEIYEE